MVNIFLNILYIIKYDGRYFVADVPKKQKVCYEFPPKKEEEKNPALILLDPNVMAGGAGPGGACGTVALLGVADDHTDTCCSTTFLTCGNRSAHRL
jgi:hypothetical protein